jgi:deoxyribodipyrimidine photolyase-related protein
LEEIFSQYNIGQVNVYNVVDNFLEKKIKKSCEERNLQLNIFETPMFLTTSCEIKKYLDSLQSHKQKYLMKNFYAWQRKRLKILIDEKGKPIGGKWSFDEDNRLKIPKNIEIPKKMKFKNDFPYATNFKDAKKCLHNFLNYKLTNFGPYEDAVLESENILFHSVLTPYLNTGLLTPKYVVEETLKFSENHIVPINSLEGFLRQIIGWREYMRMVYIELGSEIRKGNYFDSQRQIPEQFYLGTTGILPVDNSIKKIINSAYDHHIPRLMIIGNFMNLCGFQPDEVYKWFMEMYIDSYDWVMVPNVYSMALYADGGLITTKPYISGSSYISKISNFKKGEADNKNSWDKIWDALFWNFVGIHFKKLEKEGRLGFIGMQYKKMTQEKKDSFTKIANLYLESL